MKKWLFLSLVAIALANPGCGTNQPAEGPGGAPTPEEMPDPGSMGETTPSTPSTTPAPTP